MDMIKKRLSARRQLNPKRRKPAAKDVAPHESLAKKPPPRPMERVIIDLCLADSHGRGVDPIMVAKVFADDRGQTEPLAWRKWLQQVRSTAIGMARKGDLVILRKGLPADPDDFRGVYRLGLPNRG